jgi:glycosyltransferase involved in cell wall biosynthesis
LKIALVHYRVGETDGVSLEMDKWVHVLKKQGHQLLYVAGSEGTTKAHIIDSLHYQSAENNKIVYNAYNKLKDFKDGKSLAAQIYKMADEIAESFIRLFDQQQLDIIVPNNIFSLGWNLPVAIGLAMAIEKKGIACICHHHDFFWEREKYSNPTCKEISEMLIKYFPPHNLNIKHVVINKIAQKELKLRRGLDSVVIPNVFDFDRQAFKLDAYNSDLKAQTNIPEDAFVVLQATRITYRKGIELAIEFVAGLNKKLKTKPIRNKNYAILLIAGNNEEDSYYNKLIAYAKKLNVVWHDIHPYVSHGRYETENRKYYSLWDVYPHADFITYPSLLEGWGNQLIEAVFAKKPVVLYHYPVYKTDIAHLGFKHISFGDNSFEKEDGLKTIPTETMQSAVEDAFAILSNHETEKQWVEKNFEIGADSLSYNALADYLNDLIYG